MKRLMKKYLGAALAGVMLVGMASAVMAQTEATNPRGSGGVGFFNPSFLGIQVMKLEGTVEPYVIVDNDSGLLYSVCRQDQTAGTYAIAYDYYTALDPLRAFVNDYIQITPLTDQVRQNGLGAISPYVYSSGATTGQTAYRANSQWGCWTPPWPVRFEDGLIGVNDGAAGFSLFYYRTDDGVNPYTLKGG